MNKKNGTKIAVLGLSALAAACGTTDKTASPTPDGDGNTSAKVKPADEATLRKRLKALTEVRYDTSELMMAMCYSMAAPIQENYICPVCGDSTMSTSYQNGNVRSIRKVVESIKNLGYDAILDERQFCQHCSGKKIDYPSLLFKIRFSPDQEYHTEYSNLEDDYRYVLEFLQSSDKKDFVKYVNNNIHTAQKAIESIKKMTGLTVK